MKALRVAHIITGLSMGGAEMTLLRLAQEHQRRGVKLKVYSLVSDGELKEEFERAGIPVMDLGFPRGGIYIGGFLALLRDLRRWQPQLVQCWMYHANLIGGAAARLTGKSPVLWNIRNSNLDPHTSSRLTIWVMKFGAYLSFLANQIISCSQTAIDVHVQEGYPRKKFLLIPNGVDAGIFQADPDQYKNFRIEHHLPEDSLLIGMIGRYNPQKDFSSFIAAAAQIKRLHPAAHFVLCGKDVDATNPELVQKLLDGDLYSQTLLMGRQSRIQQIYQALDLLVSSSAYGEAFPNVIAEAMACEVPCVATDVGDASTLIADTGYVVPARDAQALAEAVERLFSLPVEVRRKMGHAARQRIVDQYALSTIAKRYLDEYRRWIGS